MKLEKCAFFKREVTFLGFLISDKGITVDPEKVKTLKRIKSPKDVPEIRSIMGFFNFFRNLIPDFSTIAAPINKLLKKNEKFEWGKEQEEALGKLKELLAQEPLLQYPDYDKEFIIVTDASKQGLGAVLLQKDEEGTERPVSFASRTLTKSEKNYSITEMEALGIVFALKKFKNMINRYPITVKCDHTAAIAIFAKKDYPSARLARWSLIVSDFCPRFEYIKGKKNQVADFLSRYIPEDKEDTGDVESEESEESIDYIKQESLKSVALALDAHIISMAQKTCPKLKFLYNELERGKYITGYRMFKGMIFIKQGINYKVYIPETLIETAIMLAHAAYESGHTGIERTLKRLKRRFYFKTMRKQVEEYCQQCHVCQVVKGNNPARARLGQYPLAETPWEKTGMDVLGPLPRTTQGHVYILVFKCQITKYVELVALRNRDNTTIVRYLIERVIVNHTCPETLLSDNAGEFKGTVMKEICKKFGIKKVEIAVRTPWANSNLERVNKDIENYLRCYVKDNQKDWDQFLPLAQANINNTYNASIKSDPHFLLYGYTKRMPSELPNSSLIKDKRAENTTTKADNITETLYNRIKRIREQGKDILEKEVRKYTLQQDKHSKTREVRPGDVVYMKAVKPPKLSPKLYRKWRGPFRVEGLANRFGSGNVYILRDPQNNKVYNCHADNFKLVKLQSRDNKENQVEKRGSAIKVKDRKRDRNGEGADENNGNKVYYPPPSRVKLSLRSSPQPVIKDKYAGDESKENHRESGEISEEEIVDTEPPGTPEPEETEPREHIEGAGAEQPADPPPVAGDEPYTDEESPISVRSKVRDPDKEYRPPSQGSTKILRSPIKTRSKEAAEPTAKATGISKGESVRFDPTILKRKYYKSSKE
ncbi:UNVERIFIED_CONTAM: hypothetical protein RMT77_019250 [Armadillidium vulgare]